VESRVLKSRATTRGKHHRRGVRFACALGLLLAAMPSRRASGQFVGPIPSAVVAALPSPPPEVVRALTQTLTDSGYTFKPAGGNRLVTDPRTIPGATSRAQAIWISANVVSVPGSSSSVLILNAEYYPSRAVVQPTDSFDLNGGTTGWEALVHLQRGVEHRLGQSAGR
jgi:hypothetical protein